MIVNNIKELDYYTIYGIVDNNGIKNLYILKEETEDNMKFKKVIIIQNNNGSKLAMEDSRHSDKIYRKKKLKDMIESGQIEKLLELKVNKE